MKTRSFSMITSLTLAAIALLFVASGCAVGSPDHEAEAASPPSAVAGAVDHAAAETGAAVDVAGAPAGGEDTDMTSEEEPTFSVTPDGRCCVRRCFGPPRRCFGECHPC
jgi:hypothetical protein